MDPMRSGSNEGLEVIRIRYVGVVSHDEVIGVVGACCPCPCRGKDSADSVVKGEYQVHEYSEEWIGAPTGAGGLI